MYILPPSISKKIEGYRWQSFTPPAAGKSRRFRGLICHRRSQQSNLGSALSALGKRERDNALLDEAVAALRASLEVLTRECAPVEWAQTQVNLGAALLARGDKEPTARYIHEAILARLEELSYGYCQVN